MRQPRKKQSLRVYLSAIGMGACLFFLTGLNFFVYPSQPTVSVATTQQQKQTDPGGPVEEKPAPASNNLQEEYLHESLSLVLQHVAIKTVMPVVHHYPGLPDTFIEFSTPPPKIG